MRNITISIDCEEISCGGCGYLFTADIAIPFCLLFQKNLPARRFNGNAFEFGRVGECLEADVLAREEIREAQNES